MRGMKNFFLTVFLMGIFFTGMAQSGISVKPETTGHRQTPAETLRVNRPAVDTGHHQVSDSSGRRDSLASSKAIADSLMADSLHRAQKALINVIDTATYRQYETHPFLPLHQPPLFMVIDYHQEKSKDELFYLVAGILCVAGFIKLAFSKYFKNLFLSFFQTSTRQKQTRDQLMQDNLASLLTNFLFVISAAVYLTLLVQYKNWAGISFWWLALGIAVALILVYLVKYLFLLFAGWVFNSREAAGSYIFIVFLVNKVLGVLLLPFICLLAFGTGQLVQVGITVSLGIVVLLFGYRYWVSFMVIHHKLKINLLHFFLYLCAVELLPLILIYKVLLNYFNGSL
jgi:hypothetical protein